MFQTEGFQKYFRNTSWLFVDRVVRLVAVLATSIFVTRYLGPALFGQLNYASAFVGIFFALTSMGLDDIVARDLVRDPNKRDRILGTAALIKFGGSILLFVIVIGLAFAKHMDRLTIIMIALIAAAEFLKPFTVIEPYFNSQVKGRITAQVNIAQALVSAGFKLLLVFIGAPLVWFAWAYMVEMVVLSAGFLLAYRNNGAHWRAWKFDGAIARELLTQAWPLVIYGLALYVQAKVDQVMIGDFLRGRLGELGANAEVGQYSAALKMIESLGFLPSIVVASLAPAITRARLENHQLYVDRIVNQYRLMFALFLVTAIPLYILAEPFIVLIFGIEYQPAGHLLALFAIRLFFTNMGVAKMSFITNESLFRYALITSVVGAACNIFLNWLLIPQYMSVGAIWAMIISFFVSNFLLDLFFKETRPNFKWMFYAISTFWRFRQAK